MEIIFDQDRDKVIDIKGYPKGWPYDKEKDISLLNRIYT